MRAVLCAVVVVGLSAGAIACGESDDGDGDASAQPTVARERPQAFAERVAKLIETSDSRKRCAQLDAISARSVLRLPCPAPAQLRKSMSRFEVAGAEEHGTGALVEYTSGGVADGASILLFVDSRSKEWSISRFGLKAEPAAATSDEQSREHFDAALRNYLRAVRERDCDRFVDYAATDASARNVVCRTEFAATTNLGKHLRKSRAAKPKYLGGNSRFGFYALHLPKPNPPTDVTISVMKFDVQPKTRYAVLDAAVSSSARGRTETADAAQP